MPHQVTEQIAAEIAAHRHEREARDPARQPQQQIVSGDQRQHRGEGQPDAVGGGVPGQRVDQELDGILRSDRAGYRQQHESDDGDVRPDPASQIARGECDRAIRIAAKIIHCDYVPSP
jgi:hypothetical protein